MQVTVSINTNYPAEVMILLLTLLIIHTTTIITSSKRITVRKGLKLYLTSGIKHFVSCCTTYMFQPPAQHSSNIRHAITRHTRDKHILHYGTLLHYSIAILLSILPLPFICTNPWDFHLPKPIHLTVLELTHIHFPIWPLQFTRTLKFSTAPSACRQKNIKPLHKT